MSKHNLAQINIAKARDNMNSEIMKGFVNRLDEVNTLADSKAGFIWRLQTEDGDATSIQAFDDPTLIVNMSVWEDIDSLKNFVYKTIHIELVRDRDAWFSKMLQVHQTLWWVPENHIPSVEEGKIRLQSLEENGSSDYAFTFAKPFPAPHA
ncbi:MAG: DUF3291 domain-containing protein [Oceanicoccus sp.]